MEQTKDELTEQEFRSSEYVMDGQRNIPYELYMRLNKTKYQGEIAGFRRAVIKHPIMEPLNRMATREWDDLKVISVDEAFREKNLEIRRVMFNAIGVNRLFKELKPKKLDSQTVHKKMHRWDENNEMYINEYDDTYELYEIEGKKLFPDETNTNRLVNVYAVRCWCPSTEREYWIYVPREAAFRGTSRSEGKPDAIQAIAWTIVLNISNPKRILRQGDIIIAEHSENSEKVTPYHLNKDQYLSLMYSES